MTSRQEFPADERTSGQVDEPIRQTSRQETSRQACSDTRKSPCLLVSDDLSAKRKKSPRPLVACDLSAKTLRKDERLCGRKLIEKLFHREGGRSMAAFPVRLVYMRTEIDGATPPVRMLVSVPKRCFKRAVKRNRVKRQVREAYRKHKALLYGKLGEDAGQGLVMAFIWLDDKLWDTAHVEQKVANLMQRLSEKMVRR